MDGGHGGERRRVVGAVGKRLEWDDRLLEELAYCVPLGLPHSRFLSWAAEDQDKALAFLRHEREKCSGCGVHPSQVGDDPFAFVGHVSFCRWCEAMDQEQANIPRDDKGNVRTPSAWKIGLLPRAVADRMTAEDPMFGVPR